MNIKSVIRILALACIIAACAYSMIGGPPALWQAAVLSAAIVTLWATGALPEDQTALVFFVSSSVMGLVGPDVIFSGFSTTALWLVFGGLVIGAAVRKTGVDRLIAAPIISLAGTSYWRAVCIVIGISLMLSFTVPSSMTRVMLVVPIILAFIERLGLGERGRNGLIILTVLSSYYLGSGVLTANVPNMALTGSVERNLHFHLHFAVYLFTYFPILGLLKTAVLGVLISVVFFDQICKTPEHEFVPVAEVGLAPSKDQWVVGIVLGISLLLWVTDAWHGISPAWVALTAAIIFMFPGVDIVPIDQFSRLVNLRPLLYVGGILGFGAFIGVSGLGTWIAHYFISFVGLTGHGGTKDTVALSVLSASVGLMATHGGMAALMPSLARELGMASGLGTDAVIGSIVLGYSILLLPYQVPPTVVGFHMAAVPHRIATWSTLWIGAVTALISVPCQLLWQHFTGAG